MEKYNWSNKTILIVEDEHINFRYLEEVLKKTQVTIIHAENGLDAVECAKNNNIDIILMDIKIPILNGAEATRQIRLFNEEVPIIAQTAYVMLEEVERNKDAGFNDYLTKPLKIKILLETLSKYLS